MNNEVMVKIPLDYQKLDTLPTDPANSVAYGKRGQAFMCFLIMNPISSQNAMPYDNEKMVIDGIHGVLNNDQGLIEVKSGLTQGQRKYIYSIVKTKVMPSGVQYNLTMHIDMGNQTMNIQSYFDEVGMTGMRDTTVMSMLMNQGVITPANRAGWSKDPYDENYTKGLLMNMSESAEYDAQFKEHPLSVARELVKYIIDNN